MNCASVYYTIRSIRVPNTNYLLPFPLKLLYSVQFEPLTDPSYLHCYLSHYLHSLLLSRALFSKHQPATGDRKIMKWLLTPKSILISNLTFKQGGGPLKPCFYLTFSTKVSSHSEWTDFFKLSSLTSITSPNNLRRNDFCASSASLRTLSMSFVSYKQNPQK